MSWFTFTWQNFLFSFLALAFEGLSFVLVGSLISGVCECGIVPVVRRLIDKGLPVSCGVTFMLEGTEQVVRSNMGSRS